MTTETRDLAALRREAIDDLYAAFAPDAVLEAVVEACLARIVAIDSAAMTTPTERLREAAQALLDVWDAGEQTGRVSAAVRDLRTALSEDQDSPSEETPTQTSTLSPRPTMPKPVETVHVMVPTKLLWTEWPLTAGQEEGYPFDDLVASIRTEGIRVPLTIKRDWSVIDGAHRLRVARLDAIDMVPVRIWTGVEWLP